MGDEPVPVVIWLELREDAGVETALGTPALCPVALAAVDFAAAWAFASAWPQTSQ
jgi:hypothetical protein